ncbi:hypothetical protein GTW71_31510, partial [Streptomyces sp. SID6041]|nr:hypothetical protein [Streptomyces sp. SID6041]
MTGGHLPVPHRTEKGTVMKTAGPGGRHRRGRLASALLLLVPLLGATGVVGPDGTRTVAAAADAAETTRIAYAGTGHRSLGEPASTSSSTPLFGAGPTHYDTDPSALGDRLVFASRRDEKHPQIYLRAADGGVLRLTSGLDAAHPRLTPDGGSVLFDAADPAGGPQRDLWLVRADGTGLTRLTDTPASEEDPAVSPDGARIAYSSDADPLAGRQIYVRDLAGGIPTRLTDPARGTASEPAWNPVDDDVNRAWIAYTSTTTEDGQTRQRLRITNSTTDEPLFTGAYANWQGHGAAWLPDGDGIVFLSPETTCTCRTPYDHVFRSVVHSGQEPALVLDEDRDVLSPTWLGPAEGGRPVVERSSAATVHTATLQDIRADGSDPRDLQRKILREDPQADTNTDPAKDPLFQPAAPFDPWTERQNYTPDGRRIVLTRFEGPDDARIERIWTADADGTNEAALPLDGRGARDWDTDPTFSPDGTRLAFTRTSPGGVGEAAGDSRILLAEVATGRITGEIVPPAGELRGRDAQPTWSSDGTTLAFTRARQIDGGSGNKHVWTASVADLTRQRDLSATHCPRNCDVIDDSPAFSPDGRSLAFNRKNGGGRIDERNGLLLTTLSGDACQVLLPTAARGQDGACDRELPDTTLTGPHQPRDAAWTADGKKLVFSSRATAAVNSPEKLNVLDVGSGDVAPLTAELAGRQKEPTVQQSVDLAVEAPATTPDVTVGASGTVTVHVVNHGPAASPGTRLTVVPPSGVRITGIEWPGG